MKIYSCYSDDIMFAKKLKILPHRFMDVDISIWLDSNISLLIDKERFVKLFLGNDDIGLFKHPHRDTLFEEMEAIRLHRYYAYDNVKRQFNDYTGKLKYKDDMGLFECGVLVIRHNKKTESFCEEWWRQIKKYSTRDQFSFPYVLSKHNINIKINNGDVRKNKWFKFQ